LRDKGELSSPFLLGFLEGTAAAGLGKRKMGRMIVSPGASFPVDSLKEKGYY
jgi:hypothetical protein